MKKRLVTMTFVMAASILRAAPTDSNWVLVWADECNGAANAPVDGAKWNLVNSAGGFGNAELQYYTNRTANSYYDGGGHLIIKTMLESYQGSQYTSAKLFSKNKGDWTYCRVAIRAKLPRGRCVWPAFWMMPTASTYGGWPVSGEIDIMEERGDNTKSIGSTLHFGNPWKYIGKSKTKTAVEAYDSIYHIFGMEWEAGVFRFYVDDTLFQTRTTNEWYCSGANETTNPNAPFDQNFYLQLNTAVGGPNTPYTGNQSPDNSVFPQLMTIDYVRVYQRGNGPSAAESLKEPARKFLISLAGDDAVLSLPSSQAYRIMIYGLNGRLQTADERFGNRFRVDTKSFPPGLYLVKVQGPTEIFRGPIVITR